ncbi:chorismate mutase [Natronomonas salsuginis]|jgi:chorismate mutase|uniref:Chorismate mutase n=1 Tax=Natronomonas salsuginis TaxID=2217661 RepID=A0A4U5JFM5_9EURY|nr:chorismate mutase [Natronomonas salsuginis]
MANNDTTDGSNETMMRDDPAEMDLDELRDEIRSIDQEIVERIAQRTYVAESIAAVKREKGLPTTDESQEEAVMERAGANAEQFDVDANLVKAIFRLLIELNKIEQNQHGINDGQQSNWDSDEG